MGQPNTQDIQKVYQSAFQNFQQFMGAVDNPSSSKNMETIYSNMEKLFDAFTQGALKEQGANSSILLRTVYRSLSDDFLKIVQDTEAADKIVEFMQKQQGSIKPEEADNALVSQTTKKVVTKTLDPYDCDLNQVIIDFVDELQTAILQVRLNLSREYERHKLLLARSYEGQQEDLDRLDREFKDQNDQVVAAIEGLTQNQTTIKDDQLEKLSKLTETFNKFGEQSQQQQSTALPEFKDISNIIPQQKVEKPPKLPDAKKTRPSGKVKQFNIKKILEGIEGLGRTKEFNDVETKDNKSAKQTSDLTKNQIGNKTPGQQGKESREKGSSKKDSYKDNNIKTKTNDKSLNEKFAKQEKEKNQTAEKEDKAKTQKSKEENLPEIKKEDKKEVVPLKQKEEKPQASVKPQKIDSPDIPKLKVPSMDGKGMKTPPIPSEATKLSMKPRVPDNLLKKHEEPKPIGKNLDRKDEKKVNPLKGGGVSNIPMKPTSLKQALDNIKPRDEKDGNKNPDMVSKAKVVENISKIHDKLARTFKNNKFRKSFMLQYEPVQNTIQKQMKKVGKQEKLIHKDLKATKKSIAKLKADAKKNKGGLFSLILGGIPRILFFTIGALILITLVRAGLKKWAKTYMPPTDGSTMTIFGWRVPGWDQMKAVGIGIWNWITVGLPNWWNRFKVFFGNIKNKLFGKKGILRSAAWAKHTLRRIAIAWMAGASKKVTGIFFTILGYLLALIPGWGPALQFICKFMPAVVTFIMTVVLSIWCKGKASAEVQAKIDMRAQNATGTTFVHRLEQQMKTLGRNVVPFKGQLDVIPGLELSKAHKSVGGPKRAAIMRVVPMGGNRTFESAQALQKQKMENEVEDNIDSDKKKLKNLPPDSVLFKMNEYWSVANDIKEKTRRRLAGDDFLAKSLVNADKKYLAHEAEMETLKDRFFVLKQDEFFTAIYPERRKLELYIRALNKRKKRFTDVTGPLYDPVKGWNPGYRIMQSDLMSPIPTTPFESIHNTNDVPFGQPLPDPESDSIGYMPFTWLQHGVKLAANPINYEIERAKGILAIYKKLSQTLPFDKDPRMDLMAMWRMWNNALVAPYERPSNVLYKDKFIQFLNKLRAGKIDKWNNNLGYAGLLDEYTTHVIAAGPDGIMATTMELAPSEPPPRTFVAMDDVSQYTKDHKKESRGFLGIGKSDNNERMDEILDYSTGRLKYRQVRGLMMNFGVLDWLAEPQVMAPIQKAESIVMWLVDRNIIPKGDKDKDIKPIHHLLSSFFKFSKTKGYHWSNFKSNKADQAAFAQSLLEYFKFIVLPAWNITETAMRDYFANPDENNKKLLLDKISDLHWKFRRENIMRFLVNHLRFPSMKVKVVDWHNKAPGDYALLRKYREDKGIADLPGKKRILARWQKETKDIPSMTDDVLKQRFEKISRQYKAWAYEAKYTGDHQYETYLGKYVNLFVDEINGRAEYPSGKLVQNPGKIAKVVELSGKTPEEDIEDRRKAELAREQLESEQKRKREEEEKKRLEEAAERAKEVKIAEAKIKAMERIREQEKKYETILEKMVGDPGKVTDEELKSLGDDVKTLKQEAENRIAQLPREEREMKLALIRGDKISEKTFAEVKETAIGLHGNLQEYMDEVGKIPVGSVVAVGSPGGGGGSQTVQMQDSDNIDMGDE